MKIVAVVPIKLNNSRLPGKNIKRFRNGKPLCEYVLETINSIEEISETYVYCSDKRITEYLPSNAIFLKRKDSLDLDDVSMTDVLKAFSRDIYAEIYVLCHVTAPFIKASSIKKGIDAVVSGEYDSSFSAKRIQDFLWKEGANYPLNYNLEYIPRTQDLDVVLAETSGFYVFNNNVINKLGRRIGEKPYIVEVDEIESIDIDEEKDFMIADAIYNSLEKERLFEGDCPKT